MDDFGTEMKRILLAGIGAAAATAEKSKQLIDEFVKRGELTVQQGKVLNEELKHTIREQTTQSKNSGCGSGSLDMDAIFMDLERMDMQQLELVKHKIEQLTKADCDENTRNTN